MDARDILLIVAIICAGAEAIISRSLLAAGVAFFAAAFLV